MTDDWQTSLRANSYEAARIVPPGTLEETGWDILLSLHRDCRRDLTIHRLAAMVSVPEAAMLRWLAGLEQRELITGAHSPSTGELLAVLTSKGRDLLDRDFSAAGELQASAHH